MWNGKSKGMFVGSLLMCGATALAGPDWVEGDHGDAGSLPKTSQPINMSPTGTIKYISGRLTGSSGAAFGAGDYQDMYHLRIIEPTLFCATTECISGDLCGSAEFNTRLWLFDGNGHGLLGNDYFAQIGVALGTPQGDSYIGNAPCDETSNMILLTPGDYYLAITGFDFPVGQTPSNGLQPIFDFNDGKDPGCAFGEVSGPDGEGGPYPISDWQNNLDKQRSVLGPSCFGCGAYVIALCTDSVGPLTSTVQLHADIKPGACPNPFNRGSNGVQPISILGTATFNVHDINLSTVRVGRADGMFDTARPNEGPPGPHSVYEDTGTPFDGAQCACNSAEGDGIVDLSMKFKTQDMVTAMHLNDLSTGALVPLKFTGQLNNGQAFEAVDCLRLVPPGTPPGMISVKQSMPNNFIEVSPPDLTLDGGGFGNFMRDYPVTTIVTLAAPVISQGMMFVGWKVDSNPTLQTTPNISLTVVTQTHTYEAIYVSLMSDQ
jgi:hypothetical protein